MKVNHPSKCAKQKSQYRYTAVYRIEQNPGIIREPISGQYLDDKTLYFELLPNRRENFIFWAVYDLR